MRRAMFLLYSFYCRLNTVLYVLFLYPIIYCLSLLPLPPHYPLVLWPHCIFLSISFEIDFSMRWFGFIIYFLLVMWKWEEKKNNWIDFADCLFMRFWFEFYGSDFGLDDCLVINIDKKDLICWLSVIGNEHV